VDIEGQRIFLRGIEVGPVSESMPGSSFRRRWLYHILLGGGQVKLRKQFFVDVGQLGAAARLCVKHEQIADIGRREIAPRDGPILSSGAVALHRLVAGGESVFSRRDYPPVSGAFPSLGGHGDQPFAVGGARLIDAAAGVPGRRHAAANTLVSVAGGQVRGFRLRRPGRQPTDAASEYDCNRLHSPTRKKSDPLSAGLNEARRGPMEKRHHLRRLASRGRD